MKTPMKKILTALAVAIGLTTAASAERIVSYSVAQCWGGNSRGKLSGESYETLCGTIPLTAWSQPIEGASDTTTETKSTDTCHWSLLTISKYWDGSSAQTFDSSVTGFTIKSYISGGTNLYGPAGYTDFRTCVNQALNRNGADNKITVSGIPFEKYDVIIYFAGRSESGKRTDLTLRPVKVNGGSYYMPNSSTPGDNKVASGKTDTWGDCTSSAFVYGTNVMRINGLMTGTLTLEQYCQNYGIAAIQIIDVPIVPNQATVSEDTDWSKIEWEPAIADPATAVLQLEVTDGAKITMDEDPVFASLEITGTMTVNTDEVVGEDLAKNAVAGAPYSYWYFNASGKVTGDVVASAVPEVPAGYSVDKQTVAGYGARFIVTAPAMAKFGAVSLNLHNGTALESTEALSGLYPVARQDWGNLKAAASGSTTVGDVAFTLSDNASGWYITAANAKDPIQAEYLDDGKDRTTTMTITGVPYDSYRLIVYYSTDTANYPFQPLQVNGTWYSGETEKVNEANHTVKGKQAWWGHSGPDKGANALAEGVNALTTDVLTGDATLNFIRPSATFDARATIAAIQVVKVGEVIESITEYRATIEEEGEYDLFALDWDTKPFEPSENDSAIITINPSIENEVVLNLDAEYTINSIKVVSEGSAKITLTGMAPAAIATWDFTEVAGTVDVTIETGAATVKSGVDTIVLASGTGGLVIGDGKSATVVDGVWGGTINATSAATLKLTGSAGTTVPYTAANSFAGTVVYAAEFEDGGDAGVQFFSGMTRKFDEGFSVSGGRFVTGNNAGYTQNFTQDGGDITVTGETAPDSSYASTLFAHWNSTVNYTMNGGTFTAESAAIRLGWDGKAYFTMNGGTLRTKGIASGGSMYSSPTGRDNAASFTMNGGILELGDYGIQAMGSSAPYSFGNCTIKAYDNTSIAIAHADGFKVTDPVTLDVQGHALEISAKVKGSSDITVVDSTASGTGSVAFTGDLSGYTGVITVGADVASVDLGQARPTSEFYFAGETKVKFTENIADDGVVPALTLAEGSVTPTYKVIGVDGNEKEIEDGKYVPSVTGKAALYAWEFNGNLDSVGQKADAMGKDHGPFYTDDNGAVYAYSQPYASFTWPEESTTMIACTLPTNANVCLVGFGQASPGGIALTAGDVTKNEVKLVYWQNNQPYTVLTTMKVPNAYDYEHLYLVTKTADSVKVYLDGTLVASYSGALSLGKGIQVGTVYQGVGATGLVRLDTVYKGGTNDCKSVVNAIRIYDTILGPNAVAALKEEFKYVSPNGSFSRTLPSEAEAFWMADGQWVNDATQETASKPDAESAVTLTGVTTTSVKVNLAEDTTYESITLNGDADSALTIQAGGYEEFPGKIRADGLVTVNAPVILDYAAIDIAGVPLTVSENGAITFNLVKFPFDAYFAGAYVPLTGVSEEYEDQMFAALPEETPGREVTFGYDEATQTYGITIVVEDHPFVYTADGWTWNGETGVSPAAVSNTTTQAIIVKSDLEWPIDRSVFTVEAGTLKATKVGTATITVGDGATFDVNGLGGSVYTVVMNGGSLVNTGANVGDANQVSVLNLGGDATVGGTGNFSLQGDASSQYGATSMNLGEYTLTKTDDNTFALANTTVEGTGTIYVERGLLHSSENTVFTNGTLKIGANGTVKNRKDRTFSLTKIVAEEGAKLQNNDSNGKGTFTAFTLEGTLTLVGLGNFGVITMDDATLNVGAQRSLALAGAGTVNVQFTAEEYAAKGTPVSVFTSEVDTVTIGTVTDADGNTLEAGTDYTVDGGIITPKENAPEPVDPSKGGEIQCETEDAATILAAAITANPASFIKAPDDLTEQDAAAYKAMFKATANDTIVTLCLTPAATDTLQAQVNDDVKAAAADLTSASATETTLTNVTPGMYYWVKGATDVSAEAWDDGDAVMAGSDKSVTLSKPTIEGAKSFFKIAVDFKNPSAE